MAPRLPKLKAAPSHYDKRPGRTSHSTSSSSQTPSTSTRSIHISVSTSNEKAQARTQRSLIRVDEPRATASSSSRASSSSDADESIPPSSSEDDLSDRNEYWITDDDAPQGRKTKKTKTKARLRRVSTTSFFFSYILARPRSFFSALYYCAHR